jgi:hypothetical protein
VRIDAAQSGQPTLDSFLQFARSSGDFQLDIDTSNTQVPQHGTIMMVAGKAMLIKDLTLTPGTELAALDPPLLLYALLSSTLNRVLPAGPNAIGSRQKISHVDTAAGISYATTNAQGFVPPPWSVEGSVKPSTPGSFDFDLVIKWNTPGAARPATTVVALRGSLRHQSDFHLDESTELADYSVFTLQYQSGYAAIPMKNPPDTIAQLRQQLAPEAKAPARSRK